MQSKTYEAFIEKFKPKKTTDDCMTPPEIYEAVKNYVCERYAIDPDKVIRPFWPGGDYEHYNYPRGCVVVDNPPFSILTKIIMFFLQKEIPFFLFAPAMTALSAKDTVMRVNHIMCGTSITYENGAVVNTSFVTSYEGGEVVAESCPELRKRIINAAKENRKKVLPVYNYPPHVVTAAAMNRYAQYEIEFKVRNQECAPIRALDTQKAQGKAIYGGGLLLSERVAAERAAAERAAKREGVTWELSAREQDIISALEPKEETEGV